MKDIEFSSDRIVDGLCNTEDSNANIKEKKRVRLTGEKRRHYGDDGYSLLMNGTRISKAHVACNLYQSVEELQQIISECLYYNSDLLYSQKQVLFFQWLLRNLFSLSSYAFCKGDSQRHQWPEELLEYLEEESKKLAEELGSAPDFITHSHGSLLILNKIRIAVRKVESTYVAWKQSNEMTNFLLNNPQLIDGINKHSQILNRLSTYLFWVTRKQGLHLRDLSFPVQESYWQSYCESFPSYLY